MANIKGIPISDTPWGLILIWVFFPFRCLSDGNSWVALFLFLSLAKA